MDEDATINSGINLQCFNIAEDILNDALILEQQGNYGEAIKTLENILYKIDDILKNLTFERNTEEIAVDELRTFREEILEHIKHCNRQLLMHIDSVAPPSYEEAMSTMASSLSIDNTLSSISTLSDETNDTSISTNNNSSVSYSEIGTMLSNIKIDTGAQSAQLVFSCEDVSLYFISTNGIVSVSSGPDVARIFEIDDMSSESLPKYYLQISTFVYPLIPEVSPCIQTEFGAIIFPSINVERDLNPDTESIGLIVKEDKKELFLNILENILQTKIVYCNTKSEDHVSVKISDSITSGAMYVSNFLICGAQKAEQFLNNTTPKLINRINPSERNRRVAPCVQNGVRVAKDVTAITANVTGYVVSKVGTATIKIGQFLAPHIKKGGSKILCKAIGMSENNASSKIDAVFNVTAGAVSGMVTIYNGLEESARIFGQSLSNNTVQLVTHRYGYSAGEFADNTFQTVGNSIQIGTNVRMFKPTKIIKKTAAEVIISDLRSSYNKNSCNEQGEISKNFPTIEKLTSETQINDTQKSPISDTSNSLSNASTSINSLSDNNRKTNENLDQNCVNCAEGINLENGNDNLCSKKNITENDGTC